MISKKMVDAIDRQLNREIYSAYFYLGMASYAESIGYKGVANWFKAQWKEELFHADKMFDYVLKRGSRVMLEPIEEPPQDFSSIQDLFKRTTEHEKKVTALIHKLVELAKQENDNETASFLQWFVKEQIEEEATPAGILKGLETKGKSKEGLLEIDSELAKRK